MLIAFHGATGLNFQGIDDSVGHLKDCLFDPDVWQVRYLVADTGVWLPGRKVLLCPSTVGYRNWTTGIADVHLSREQIESSPTIDERQPISRKLERQLANHFEWPVYFGGGGVAGLSATTSPASDRSMYRERELVEDESVESLRSACEVKGYYIAASDGDIGHVEEFIVDDEAWCIRYIVVDTKNWLPGRKVLVSPTWIDAIRWLDNHVSLNLSRTAVKDSPPYDPTQAVNRRYEEYLHDHYGRQSYWN